MKKDEEKILDALRMLNIIGAMDRNELCNTISGLSNRDVSLMLSNGVIRKNDFNDFVYISNSGRKKIGTTEDRPRTPSRTHVASSVGKDDFYDGAELRPYTGRPGSEAALSLPSRLPDGLHYPCGRFVPEGAGR